MRRFFPLLFVLVLLLPSQALAASDTDITGSTVYSTVNGMRTVDQMRSELTAIGYGGPWDNGAVVSAYFRTTGNGSTATSSAPAAAKPLPSATASREAVIFVGGLASQLPGDFGDVKTGLLAAGFSQGDLIDFSYGGSAGSPYDPGATCETMATARQQLGQLIRDAHGNNRTVAVVGHSLGGAIGLDTMISNSDLAPFYRKLVTSDSPLLGLTRWRADEWESMFLKSGYCSSIEELVGRSVNRSSTDSSITAGLNRALGRGQDARFIVNDSDCVFNLPFCTVLFGANLTWDQGVNLPLNWEVNVNGCDFLNHSCALHDVPTVAKIVAFISN